MAMVSIVQYIQELKKVGFTDQQAEVQAKEMEFFITEVRAEIKEEIQSDIRNLHLATKNDLKELEIRLIKWVVGTSVATIIAVIGTLSTVIKFFVH